MPRKVYDDEELKHKALELRKKGYSYREIAKELGCSIYKVHELISPYEAPRSRLKQVTELAGKVDELLVKVNELTLKLDEYRSGIEDLKPVKDVSDRLSKLEEEVKDLTQNVKRLDERINPVSEAIDMMRLNAVWKRDHCRYFRDDGYCYNWHWHKKVAGWEMKKDIVGEKAIYRLNVKRHAMYCSTCPSFKRRA